MKGTIAYLNLAKGFGFVAPQGAQQQQVFFHISDLDESLSFDEQLKEMPVEFNLVSTPKGPRCVAVRPIS